MKLLENKQLTFFEYKVEKNDYKDICNNLSQSDNLNPDEFGKAIKNWSKQGVIKPINIVALFSGAGGLDIGFCDAGFTLIESVELEEKFVKTMLHNQSTGMYFPNASIKCQDIRTYLPNTTNKIDFVIGGPPCQSFSAAGRRAAGVAGTKDERGNLFEEYVRVLKILQPKGFLFENVYGLLGAEKGESIKKIRKAFKEIGYETSYRILDAADFGVPQHRERLIIVGSKDKLFKFPKPTHGLDSNFEKHFSAQEAINTCKKEEVNTPTLNGRFGHLLNEIPPGLNYSFFTEKMGHPNPIFAWRSKFSDFLYKADPKTPIRTLKASGGQYTGPFHWNNRHFSLEELKRLQTFPDDYKILGNKAIANKQIGNSVPPQFARILALSVLDQFFEVKLPFDFFYLEEKEELSFRKLKIGKRHSYQEKATSVLSGLGSVKKNKILAKEYHLDLTEKFKLKSNPKSNVIVYFEPKGKNWTFKLTRQGFENEKELYRIEIKKIKQEPLFDSINSVQLISYTNNLSDYTILWKVFEKALADNHFKADLVQLNGYYQYSNDIKYTMSKNESEVKGIEWRVIELMLNDPFIGQIQSIHKLSRSYDVNEQDLIKCFYSLRKNGFEIRNKNTNPEIEEGDFLIPYKFPTLTHLSVQLKKSL